MKKTIFFLYISTLFFNQCKELEKIGYDIKKDNICVKYYLKVREV